MNRKRRQNGLGLRAEAVRPRRTTRAAWHVGLAATLVLLLATGGCGTWRDRACHVARRTYDVACDGFDTRSDPHYNRYCPNQGEPTLLRRAETLVSSAEETLDNLNERLENMID